MATNEDAIDVEFETLTANTPNNHSERPSRPTPIEKSGAADDDQLAVFGQQPDAHQHQRMSLPLFTFVASVCAVVAFYMAGGHVIFANQQTTAAIVQQDQKLQFRDMTTDSTIRNGSTILTIRATIVNTDKIARTLPPVIVNLGDDPKTRRMFRINRGETLNPGERLIFTNSIPAGEGPISEPVLSFSE